MKGKEVLKLTLLGAMVGVILFDIVSIILYLTTGIKIGLENTMCLISCYIFSATYIPVMIIGMYYCKKIEFSDITLVKRVIYTSLAALIMVFVPLVAFIVIDMAFKLDAAIILLLLNFVGVMIVVGITEFVIFMKNKGNIKEINKKIKERLFEKK